MTLSLPQIEATIKAKGYSWFSTGDYNLNIVGVRNSATGNRLFGQNLARFRTQTPKKKDMIKSTSHDAKRSGKK